MTFFNLFLNLKKLISISHIHRKLYNNDMQYLIKCSEKIVMNSMMDISVFEVSITLFKYLNISILRYRMDTNRDG